MGADRRRHRTLLTVLLPHGGTVQMKEGNIKRVFWQTPPLHVPRDWERRTRGLTEQMAAVSVADLMERERNQGPEAALAAIECHRCPWGFQNRCEQEHRGIERTRAAALSRRRRRSTPARTPTGTSS